MTPFNSMDAHPMLNWWRGFSTKGTIGCLTGIFLLILTPYLHFGLAYSFWNSDKKPVDRKKCQCSCWDTYFKGSYETNTPGYKHLYFNITHQTLQMWILTIVAAIVAYEVIKHLVNLFLSKRLRYLMFSVFISVLYSHYYSWWGYINAYNDDFYDQWYHQALFSVTEIISTMAVVHLCSKENNVKPRLLMLITAIAMFHILASGADQFIENVIRGRGKWHQFSRDLGFMVPDILHIVASAIMLREHAQITGCTIKQLLSLNDVITALVSVLLLWGVCLTL